MVQPGRATLEQRGDDDEFQLFCQRANALGTGSRDWFSAVEFLGAFDLAEIRPVVQFLQEDQGSAGRSGVAQAGFDCCKISLAAAAIGFLQQRNLEEGGFHVVVGKPSESNMVARIVRIKPTPRSHNAYCRDRDRHLLAGMGT